MKAFEEAPGRREEIPLSGGNVAAGVVRVGSTVRKPWTPAAPSVAAFMGVVREAGVDVPEVLGRDAGGRVVTEFVPGRLAQEGPALTLDELRRVGRLVRSIHDASVGFRAPDDARWDTAIPAPGDDLVCHNDLAPWNLLVGERWVFIDWDAAAPSTRLWDLAYAAQVFTLGEPDAPPWEAARRLTALVDGYAPDLVLRTALPGAMAARAAAMRDHLRDSHRAGREPWATMHDAGHGAHWRHITRYVEENGATWRRALEIA